MKKNLIALFLIAAVALGLIGPKIIGNNLEESTDEFIATLNKTPGYQVTVLQESFNWFSSSMTVNVGIDPSLFEELPVNSAVAEIFSTLSTNLNITAQHGPFLYLNGLDLGGLALRMETESDFLREIISYSQSNSLYLLEADIGLLGNMSYIDKIQAFSSGDAGGKLTFSGWAGEGSLSSNYLAYKGNMDTLTFGVAEGTVLAMNSLSASMTADSSWTDMMINPVYDSTSELVLGSLTASIPTLDDMNIAIKNMVLKGTTATQSDEQLLNIGMAFNVGELTSGMIESKNLVFKSEINNLEKGFILAAQEGSLNAQDVDKVQEVLSKILLPQLQASPEVIITELSGTVEEGNFSGNVLIKLDGIDKLPDYPDDPKFWLSKVSIDSRIEANEDMAMWLGEAALTQQFKANPAITESMTAKEIKELASAQTAGTLDVLSQQGMLSLTEEGNFELTFSLENGQAKLNGNPMPLPF
tara:strand:- start:1184 stop:2596 length:1413 start_codon:yes stop_codon:yes gene_type:complete